MYSKAPIVEAIFDVQVELPKRIGISELEAFCLNIADAYPVKKERRRFEGRFEVKNGKEATTESMDLGIDGFLNWSQDEKQVLQVRLDGCGFSRLKPYESWDQHFSEFIKNLKLYFDMLSPVRVNRVTTRFINVIEIPLGKIEWDKYFVNAVRAPIRDALVTNFFNRLEFNVSEFNAKAVVTYTIMQSNDPIFLPVVLDIEVFTDVSSAPDDKVISMIFQKLRKLKNDIFEENLTPQAKELFR